MTGFGFGDCHEWGHVDLGAALNYWHSSEWSQSPHLNKTGLIPAMRVGWLGSWPVPFASNTPVRRIT